jgi:Gpi18-like mannosyltransferase
MQLLKTALKEAGWVFLVSRAVILFVTYIAISLLPVFGNYKGHTVSFLTCTQGIQPNPCWFAWYRWDANAYVRIAHQGYAATQDVAFFPLWPTLERGVGLILGGVYPMSYYVAGLLLSNLFFFVALILLYCLLAEDFEHSVARRALFYLSFYPYALFFFAGYTESIFLMLCLGIFLLLRRGNEMDWWFAGGLGLLATLTRSTGILLIVPFLVLYIKRYWWPSTREQAGWLQKINAIIPILLIPAGILFYALYLWQTKGNPLIFQTMEAKYWTRHFAFIGTSLYTAANAIITHSRFSLTAVLNLLDLLFIAVPAIALIFGWRRIPLHYSLFALAIVLFSLSFPTTEFNLLESQPRYLMAAFPIFVVFALWGKRPRFDQLYTGFAPALLALFSILFVLHFWVA